MKQNHEEHKEQHYHNHEACGCGHDHEHEACGCGHDHEHGSGDKESHSHVQSDAKQKVYIFRKSWLCKLCGEDEEGSEYAQEVEDAVITFATKQLKVASNHQGSYSGTAGNLCIDRV